MKNIVKFIVISVIFLGLISCSGTSIEDSVHDTGSSTISQSIEENVVAKSKVTNVRPVETVKESLDFVEASVYSYSVSNNATVHIEFSDSTFYDTYESDDIVFKNIKLIRYEYSHENGRKINSTKVVLKHLTTYETSFDDNTVEANKSYIYIVKERYKGSTIKYIVKGASNVIDIQTYEDSVTYRLITHTPVSIDLFPNYSSSTTAFVPVTFRTTITFVDNESYSSGFIIEDQDFVTNEFGVALFETATDYFEYDMDLDLGPIDSVQLTIYGFDEDDNNLGRVIVQAVSFREEIIDGVRSIIIE
jgi:hypothetical protein